MLFHSVYTLLHLESPGSCARFLFVDFSSTFNCILPHKLSDCLLDLGVAHLLSGSSILSRTRNKWLKLIITSLNPSTSVQVLHKVACCPRSYTLCRLTISPPSTAQLKHLNLLMTQQ
ncbi:hypothetical protein LDENG_00181700 [Lucifuga dentata]|nr:hypothetical protein LDENG_00181700 [Lucifuga dentata]